MQEENEHESREINCFYSKEDCIKKNAMNIKRTEQNDRSKM